MRSKSASIVALAVLLVGLLTWQQVQMQRWRAENQAMRQEMAELEALRAAANQRLKSTPLSLELARSHAEHLELMQLRDEVTRLRAAVRMPSTAPPTSAPAPVPPMVQTRFLLPPTKARVANGMTLAVGGWTAGDGKRGLVLVTPIVGGEGDHGGSPVTVACTLLEGDPGAFAAVGWGSVGGAAEDVRDALSAEAASALLRKLVETGGVDVLSAPRVTTLDGRQAQIVVGAAGGTATAIDILPTVEASAEGATVEMTLFVTHTPVEAPASGPVILPLPVLPDPAGQP